MAMRDRRMQRTHAGRRGVAEDSRKNIHGVHELCPLAQLYLFDVVWDFVPDMMHLIDNIMDKYIVGSLKGDRDVKPPTLLSLDGHDDAECAIRRAKNNKAKRDYAIAAKVRTQTAPLRLFFASCRLFFCQ